MAATIVGIFCLLWAAAATYIAVAKPAKIWQLGKIQGFATLLGNTGATILFLVLAAGMGVLGVYLTFLV